MAITEHGIVNAEITLLKNDRNTTYRDANGSQKEYVDWLPWVLVKFGDKGEERKYVMPKPYTGLFDRTSSDVHREIIEAGQNHIVSDASGVVTVHLFGGF